MKHVVDAEELDGFTIGDAKHHTIPRTPQERAADRTTSAWMRKAEHRRRSQKARDRAKRAQKPLD